MNYDIIIVGGAISGTVLALALSSQTNGKIKIAVIEKHPMKDHRQSGFDARCIALSDGSCQQFMRIHLPDQQTLWQHIQPLATPIRHIHVSDKGHSGIAEFSAQEFHLTQLGAVVELNRIGQILLQSLEQYQNIDYLCPAEIVQIEHHTDEIKISLKNDRILTAKLLIGADGTKSQVASAAGITQAVLREYPQTAIITNIRPQQAHQNRAFERFTEDGPLALLPMMNNLMSLVWCVKNGGEVMQLDEPAFLASLQQHFGWRLGKLQQCGQRFAYPLNLSRAARHIALRTVLISNAAQTLHPIAGQGFNLGIRDVMTLTNILSVAYQQQKDLGEHSLLQQYEDARKGDQENIIKLTDGLVSIFSNQLLPLQIGRNLGLMVLSQCTTARQYFAKPTLGWGSHEKL
ncbi:MAG TPA: 2-octaprenyl-6-methoxyphenyl hydroxylase [Pasteurellaceae bacterium]|nr:2-octaprenyl-6-methoxyphenyl hydroxylase [Pasteurellaceae bacterium]